MASTQTAAETMLATWKVRRRICSRPAISGTKARKGPKKRPMKIEAAP